MFIIVFLLLLFSLSRRSFCSGSSRVGLIWSVCVVPPQQTRQQSRRSSAAAAAAAAEHTYLNPQQPVVLTNSNTFHLFFFNCHAKKKPKSNLIFYTINAKIKEEKNRHQYRKTNWNSAHLKYTISGFLSQTHLFLFFNAKRILKKYPKREPVYAKLLCMHNLWIIYFCINVQNIWRTTEKVGEQTRKAKELFTPTNTATDWQWSSRGDTFFILPFHCHYYLYCYSRYFVCYLWNL